MLRQLEADRKDWVRTKDVYKSMADFWKRVEQTASEYAKNPSVETADGFYVAVFGVGRKGKESEPNA